MKKIALLAAMLTSVAVVAPAQATKHKCVAHPVSYRVSGTLTTTGSLTANSDGRYSGTLTVHVTNTNKHAKADKGLTKTYTLADARVTFSHGVDKTMPAEGSRVTLKGTITTIAKKCPGFGFTPTITIKKVGIHAAKKK